MKMYLVKEVSRATAENLSFAGETSTVSFGKGQKQIKREGNHLPENNFDLTSYMVKDYGYRRRGDAKRSWVYRNPENSRFWASKVEIVAIEAE